MSSSAPHAIRPCPQVSRAQFDHVLRYPARNSIGVTQFGCSRQSFSPLQRSWVKTYHFMQDGAPSHARSVRGYLQCIWKSSDWFRIPLICLQRDWVASILPRFKSLWLFLWGYNKDHCYSENPTTTEELIKAIRKTVNSKVNVPMTGHLRILYQ